MTTIELMKRLLLCKNIKELINILNRNRVPAKESKYC